MDENEFNTRENWECLGFEIGGYLIGLGVNAHSCTFGFTWPKGCFTIQLGPVMVLIARLA